MKLRNIGLPKGRIMDQRGPMTDAYSKAASINYAANKYKHSPSPSVNRSFNPMALGKADRIIKKSTRKFDR